MSMSTTRLVRAKLFLHYPIVDSNPAASPTSHLLSSFQTSCSFLMHSVLFTSFNRLPLKDIFSAFSDPSRLFFYINTISSPARPPFPVTKVIISPWHTHTDGGHWGKVSQKVSHMGILVSYKVLSHTPSHLIFPSTGWDRERGKGIMKIFRWGYPGEEMRNWVQLI